MCVKDLQSRLLSPRLKARGAAPVASRSGGAAASGRSFAPEHGQEVQPLLQVLEDLCGGVG